MANHTAQTNLPPANDDHSPERRHGDRVPVRLRILVKSADADFVEMRSSDVSSGGMFVTAQTPLRLGTLVRICRNNGVNIDGVGRVAWVRGLEQSSLSEPPGMGIKFIKLSAQSKQEIEQLAASPLVEPSSPRGETTLAQPRPVRPAAAPREPASGIRAIHRTLPPVSPAVLARSAKLCAQQPSAPPGGEPRSLQLPPSPFSSMGAPLGRPRAKSTPPPISGAALRAASSPVPGPSNRSAFQNTIFSEPDASEYADASAFVQDVREVDESPELQAVAVPSEPSPVGEVASPVSEVASPAQEEVASFVQEEAASSAEAIGVLPEAQAVAALPSPQPEVRRAASSNRRTAVAVAAGLGLVFLTWGAWPKAPPTLPTPKPVAAAPLPKAPEPPPPAAPAPQPPVTVAVVTLPEGAEVFVGETLRGRAPLELELQANTPVTLRARAPGHAEARVEWTPVASEEPVRLELKPLSYVVHVETDPPGAWLSVAGQRASAPADIELRTFKDKRIPVTAGLYRYLNHLVYVPREAFVERDGALRAEVKVKLKFDRQFAAAAATPTPAAQTTVGPAAPAAE